jgi:hypothetical protein
MKKKFFSILLASVLISATVIFAQTTPMNFAVHEDIVKPSMDVKYRETMTRLKAACEQHKVNFSWTSFGYDDNSYVHLAPLKSFADLDKNPFADLETKMNKEELAKLFTDFDECLESHSDFVVAQQPVLSYLLPTESDIYRNVTFWQPLLGKDNEAEAIMGEWKKLYESKKATNGFLLFKVIYGREPGYAIVSWGKNAGDEASKHQKTLELLGEDGNKLWLKTQAITKKIYSKRAELLPQFSYSLPKL